MYIVGDVLPFAVSVKDAAGVLANAGAMTLTVLRDDVAVAGSPFTVTPTSTGLYDRDVTSTAAGRYVGYWLATGTNSGAHTQVFEVGSAADAGLVSLAQVKAHLGKTTTRDDDELELMIAAATESIEDRVGPVVRRTVTGERQRHNGTEAIYLRQAPVISVTSVTPVDGGTALTVGLLDIDPTTGRVAYADGSTRFGSGVYLWTYVAGRSLVPAGLQLAALNYIRGSWETQRGAAGLPLAGAEEATEVPGMGLVNWRLEQDLRPFVRLPGIA